MGRPKGSKNKKKAVKKKAAKKSPKKSVKKDEVKKAAPKKRGRPKKFKKPAHEPDDYKPPKAVKFLGYCTKCKGMITSKDLASKLIFICPVCHKRARINVLRKERRLEKYNSKKDYLGSSSVAPSSVPMKSDVVENVKVSRDA